MKWATIQEVVCPACGGRFSIPTAELLALWAICPGCGASLAGVGENALRSYAKCCREFELGMIAYEILKASGVDLAEVELPRAESLEELSRLIACHLPAAPDRDAHATQLVTEVARRVAPDLLLGPGYVDRVIQQECSRWRSRAAL